MDWIKMSKITLTRKYQGRPIAVICSHWGFYFFTSYTFSPRFSFIVIVMLFLSTHRAKFYRMIQFQFKYIDSRHQEILLMYYMQNVFKIHQLSFLSWCTLLPKLLLVCEWTNVEYLSDQHLSLMYSPLLLPKQ